MGTFGSSVAVSPLPECCTDSTFTQYMPVSAGCDCFSMKLSHKTNMNKLGGVEPSAEFAQCDAPCCVWIWTPRDFANQDTPALLSCCLCSSFRLQSVFFRPEDSWHSRMQFCFHPKLPTAFPVRQIPGYQNLPVFIALGTSHVSSIFKGQFLLGIEFFYLLTYILVLEFSTGVEYMVESLFLSAFRVPCHAFWIARFGWEVNC